MLQDSFAVYASAICELDLHVNIWTNLKASNYIDIGLRIYKKESFGTLSVYIPYNITENDIIDLSEILKDETTMRGIFNQDFSITITSADHYYDVKLSDCSMRVFPVSACLTDVNEMGAGTILTFCISQWSNSSIAYLRFRLPYKSLSQDLSAKKHIYVEALESPIMKEKILYNFKVNESRTLPKDVLKEVNESVTIKCVNIFICVPDNCSVGTDTVYKTRIIEDGVFKGYVPDKLFEKDTDIYQWNYGKKTQYTLSTFFERRYINWISIMFYATAIVLLNLISSYFFQALFLS